MKRVAALLIFLVSAICFGQLKAEHAVYFDTDKDQFVTSEGESLDKFFDDLLYKPLLKVSIFGYCDDRGSRDYNMDLSNRRVESVYNWLLAHDIGSLNIERKIEGLGEVELNQELDDETIQSFRAANRRVDVIFTLAQKIEDRLAIKTLRKNTLSDAQKAVIADYEKKVIEAVKSNPEGSTVIENKVLNNFEEYLDIPSKITPPIDNRDEPMRSLLSKNLKEGQVINLENILFYQGRSTILPESLPILERIAEILISRNDIVFEIHGHVCCISPTYVDAYNRDTGKSNLSEARAKEIYRYLAKRGVSSSRMKSMGFGRKKPLGGIDKLDRRVELVITKMKK